MKHPESAFDALDRLGAFRSSFAERVRREGHVPSPIQNTTLDLGPFAVRSEPVRAFRGSGRRVFATADEALADLAREELALTWARHFGANVPDFRSVMQCVERTPDLFVAMLALTHFEGGQHAEG